MTLKDKYTIVKRHISNKTNRPQRKRRGDRYGVAHETGNNSAGALAHVNYFNNNNVQASYQQLVDSHIIVEIIPMDEEAFHVQRQRDRQTLGKGVANHYGMAISLCRTGDFSEAYDRFVWAWAKYCVETNKNPKRDITAHSFEDPERRSDVQSWLTPNGVSWSKFLNDVERYVKNWNGESDIEKPKGGSSQPTGSEDLIRHGDKGDQVNELQNRLIEAGYDLPRFGADGSFGDETESALRNMQTDAGILVDGIYGPQSSDALDDMNKPKTQRLERGAKGKEVVRLQERLMLVGEQLPRFGADGDFGEETEAAVQTFQSRYNISSPSGNFFGVAGNQTLSKLEELLTYTGLIRYRQGYEMKRGEKVKMVQSKVGTKTDGVFGPKSRDAVRDYQRQNNLTVDGIVGTQTFSHMFG